MKKLSLFIVLCMSFFTFAGCGVKGGSLPMGIEFVRDVFYVDYNVETHLDYKIYPSTAENVYVNYEIKNDSSLTGYFDFSKDGSILIYNQRFTSIGVKVKLNDHSDECEVKLKEYPSSIQFKNDTENINAGCVMPLDLEGLFDGEVKSCKDRQYNFKLSSSNPSVVQVISEDNLTVKSTGRRGKVTIDVQICDSANQEKSGLKASVELNVVDDISEAFITLGSDKVLHDGDVLDYEAAEWSDDLKLDVKYFNEIGILNTLFDCNLYLSNDDVFEIVEDNGQTYLRLKTLEPLEEGECYSVKLTILSEGVMDDGSPHKIECTFRVFITNNVE